MTKSIQRAEIIQKRNKLTIRSETIALLTGQLSRVEGGALAAAAASCPCVSADIMCDTTISTL